MTNLVWAIMIQQWNPVGLEKTLRPIAQMESSFGINMRHAKHPLGVYWTAYGALGLKPVVAHEDYMASKYAQRRYPGLTDISVFTVRLMFDVRFYNFACNLHLYLLTNQGHDLTEVLYQWRHGKTRAAAVGRAEKEEDPYVVQYFSLTRWNKWSSR